MPGRGDNNKSGSAGRGSSNQSNQPFIADGEKQPRSNHGKQQTGGEPSIKQSKTTDGDRNAGTVTEKIKPLRTDERTLNLVVDDVPYLVKVSPFTFNGESRFYVNINGGDDHVFTWDSELGGLRAIDDNASVLPNTLEEAISKKLQSQQK
jgi:hypothetical protein